MIALVPHPWKESRVLAGQAACGPAPHSGGDKAPCSAHTNMCHARDACDSGKWTEVTMTQAEALSVFPVRKWIVDLMTSVQNMWGGLTLLRHSIN